MSTSSHSAVSLLGFDADITREIEEDPQMVSVTSLYL